MKALSYSLALFMSVGPVTGQTVETDRLKKLLSDDTVAIRWETPPGAVPPFIEHQVAILASPKLSIAEPGTTIRDALLDGCPGAGDPYLDAFETMNDSVRMISDIRDVDRNLPLDEPTLFLIPACIGLSFPSVSINSNRLPWDIYQESSTADDVVGGRDWSGFEDAARQANNGVNFENLADGQLLKIPPRVITIRVPRSNAEQLAALLSAVPQGGAVSIVTETAKGSLETSFETDSSCSPNQLSAIYESDSSQHSELIKSIIFSVDLAKNVMPSTVLIADAGMRRISHPLMSRLARPPLQSSTIEQVYQLPLSTVEAAGCYRGPSRSHGEAVLGVAMGGFYATLPNSVFSPIRPLVHNTYTDFIPRLNPSGTICIDVQPKATDLLVTLNELAPQGVVVDVVNLSQSWAGDEAAEPLKKLATSNSASFLLVAAAGNKAKDLDALPTYPSAYGSGEDSRIVVVAALHEDNKLHPLSSFNNEMVDIAANGCNVPTINFKVENAAREDSSGFQAGELDIGFSSGTSFAAPRVSYAAAMIKYLSGDNPMGPVRLKHRLMASSDIEGVLFDKVRHGRVLNTAKSLSLYHDVITLAGEDDVLRRGFVRVDDPDDGLVQVCPTWETDRSGLLKISKVTGGDMDGQYLIYYRDGGVFKHKLCNNIGNIFFAEQFSPADNSSYREIEASTIQDVVFKEF